MARKERWHPERNFLCACKLSGIDKLIAERKLGMKDEKKKISVRNNIDWYLSRRIGIEFIPE